MSEVPLLDFDLLDSSADSANGGRRIADAKTETLGPAIELEWLKPTVPHLPSLADLAPNRRTAALLRSLREDDAVLVSAKKQRAGFVRTLWTHRDNDQRFYKFCSSAQQAAEIAGISRLCAQKLVGAIGELEDNIHVHSGHPHSGLIGFCAKDGTFEFVIADKGIGVLRSLQSRTEVDDIHDDGAALDAVVRHGVSRFGPGTGHGNGFRPLFSGLYNLNCRLRFRSGNSALIMDGRIGREEVHLLEVAVCTGFVISVFCRP